MVTQTQKFIGITILMCCFSINGFTQTKAAKHTIKSPTGITLNIMDLNLDNTNVLHANIELKNGSKNQLYSLAGIAAGQPGIMVNGGSQGPMGISPDGSLSCAHEETTYFETFMIWFGENCISLESISPGAGDVVLENFSVGVTPFDKYIPVKGARTNPRADFSIRFLGSSNVKKLSLAQKKKASEISAVAPAFNPGATWKYKLRLPIKVDANKIKSGSTVNRKLSIEFTVADDKGFQSVIPLRYMLIIENNGKKPTVRLVPDKVM